jgi:hypothetical protein
MSWQSQGSRTEHFWNLATLNIENKFENRIHHPRSSSFLTTYFLATMRLSILTGLLAATLASAASWGFEDASLQVLENRGSEVSSKKK